MKPIDQLPINISQRQKGKKRYQSKKRLLQFLSLSPKNIELDSMINNERKYIVNIKHN